MVCPLAAQTSSSQQPLIIPFQMHTPQEPKPGAASEAPYGEVRRRAREILDHVLRGCSITTAMQRHVQVQDGQLWVGAHRYDLPSFERVSVVSLGKAGHTLAEALSEIMGGGLSGII